MRVLLLTCEKIPTRRSRSRQDQLASRTERDLLAGLADLDHAVRTLTLFESIEPLVEEIERRRPDIVLNLMMQLRGSGTYEPHIASYLELVDLPYTGCGPLGLTQSRDKVLSKQILTWHGVPTPPFQVHRRGRRPEGPAPPLPAIVKPTEAACSLGISRASVVSNRADLRDRVRFLHERLGVDAIAEQYVPGRDLTVGVLGNRRAQCLPVWETFYGPTCDLKIATQHLKWRLGYRERMGVHSGPAKRLNRSVRERVEQLAKRAYGLLGMEGFGRVDLRLDDAGGVHVLEVNPNPDLDFREDFVRSAVHEGYTESELIDRILKLGLAAARARD